MRQICKNRTRLFSAYLFIALGWLTTGQTFAQCDATNTLTIPGVYTTSALVGNGNFNGIVFGNLTATGGDVEGRLAVGGNFSVNTGYSVGLAVVGPNPPANTDNFIVNNIFTNSSGISWGIGGNFIYTTNAPGSTLPSHFSGTTTQGVPDSRIKFSTLKNYYITLSHSLNALPTVGSSSVSAQNEITLIGDGTPHNYVFNITLPNGILSGVTFTNIPVVGSTIVINVLNPTVSITGGAIANTAYRPQTLFNFPNATTIGLTNFLLEGSFLAPNATVTGSGGGINGQSVVGGNLLQMDGFEFHNFCLSQSPSNPLPVTLSSFTVAKEEQATRLAWTTVNEENNRGFAIEHSLDAKTWKQLTFVTGVGTSTQTNSYTYRHAQPEMGTNYYRLGQVDFNGRTTYSSIRTVSFPEIDIAVYPNPAAGKVYVTLPSSRTYPYQLDLFNQLGRSVLSTPKEDVSSAIELDVQHLAEGTYLLQLVRDGRVTIRKLIVKH